MSFIPELFAHPLLPQPAKDAAFTRCTSDPGLPLSSPPIPPATQPFWFETPHPLFAGPATADLPAEVDILIIGSGITGTSVARHLLRSPSSSAPNHGSEVPRVLMLDARAVCSGATGRNGGHINEVGYSDYVHLSTLYGRDAAKKITLFRMGHLEELVRVARKEGVGEESMMREVEGVSAFFDAVALDVAKKGLREMREDLGKEVEKWVVIEKAAEGLEELGKLGLLKSEGVIKGRAGAVWPYKLVTGILANLLRDFPERFGVLGYTPATNVVRTGDGYFIVETPRGNVKARHVVHATNGYAGHLLPPFRGAIFPLRGQMSAQSPPPWFPNQALQRSWAFEYDVGFDYLTQIPENTSLKSSEGETKEEGERAKGGDLMFGGGFVQTENFGLGELGRTDDNALNDDASEHLTSALRKAFQPPADHEEEIGESSEEFEVKSMWTGILGFSTDSLPWVGRLPESITKRTISQGAAKQDGKGAEWISAAYSGEGMVNAWGCGKAVASMILGREREDRLEEWFPMEMLVTEERLERAALENMLGDSVNAVPEDELAVSA